MLSTKKEGMLYKTVRVGDTIFEIKYGYYEDFERARGEPVPIYPDLKKNPQYTCDGQLLVTAMQDPCGYFDGADKSLGCFGCSHYSQCEDLIGICDNPKNRTKN